MMNLNEDTRAEVSFDEFSNSLIIPKQQTEDNTTVPPKEFSEHSEPESKEKEPEETIEAPDDQRSASKEKRSDAKKVATNYFEPLDTGLTLAASMWADEDYSEMELPKTTRESIVEKLEHLAEVNEWKDPGEVPSLAALAIGMYGQMFYTAYRCRKEKNEAKKEKKAREKKERETAAKDAENTKKQ